jgi:hypothetical protein
MPSFWDRKFSGPAGPPSGPSTYSPPPIPGYDPRLLPNGMAQSQQQMLREYQQRQVAQQQPQGIPMANNPFDGSSQTDPYGHHGQLGNYQGNLKGGLGETLKTGNCPGCGSPLYFSRSYGAITNTTTGQLVYPMAECLACGYPREQLGSGGGSGGAKVVGIGRARQGSASAPSGSLNTQSGALANLGA